MDAGESNEHQDNPTGNIEQFPATTERQNTAVNNSTSGDQSTKKETNWPQRIEAICAMLLVLITGCYTFYARKQLKAMQGQITEMKNTRAQTKFDNASAIIAEQAIAQNALTESQKSVDKSLGATIDNFQQEQRAWLNAQPAIGIPKSDAPYKIQIPILNSGKTPAKHLMVYFTGKFVAEGEKVAYTFLGVPQPSGIATPGPSITFTYDSTGIPKSGDYVAAHKGDKFIIFGAITYEDVFDAKHWLTYCFFTRGDNSYAYCTEHNEFGDGPLPPNSLK
jgi:hypothetical protein